MIQEDTTEKANKKLSFKEVWLNKIRNPMGTQKLPKFNMVPTNNNEVSYLNLVNNDRFLKMDYSDQFETLMRHLDLHPD